MAFFACAATAQRRPLTSNFALGVKGATPLPDNDITLFHADSTGQITDFSDWPPDAL